MMKNLYIITGTTRGLGEAFFQLLNKNNIIITINRDNIIYNNDNTINICMDLSNVTSTHLQNFENILSKKLLRNIKKVVFINNAFRMGELSRINELQNFDIENSIQVNLVSSILLLKSFITKTMEYNIEKKILNISSGAAKYPIFGWSIYCTTKSAMEMFINAIPLEYPSYTCFNIDPGVMNTQMQVHIREYKEGKNNEYFKKLHNNNELKETIFVANKVIKEYDL